MRKIFCILLALLLCLQVAPVVRAEETPRITVADVQQCSGEQISLVVALLHNPGYCNIELEVVYDSDALKLTDVEPVDMPGMFAAYAETNRIAAAGISNLLDDGVMCILHFDILAPGEHTVSLNVLDFGNEAGDVLPVSVSSGTVLVGEHSYHTEIKEATCTQNGATVHTCLICGHTYETDRVISQGHVFDDGQDMVCNICGLDTSKPAKPDISDVLQEENPWLMVLLAVLILAVMALSVAVVILLKRKQKAVPPLEYKTQKTFDSGNEMEDADEE